MGQPGAPGGAAPQARPRGVAWVSLSLGGVLAVLLLVMSGVLVADPSRVGSDPSASGPQVDASDDAEGSAGGSEGSSGSEGGSGDSGAPPDVPRSADPPGVVPELPGTDLPPLAEWLEGAGIAGELARAGLACLDGDATACGALASACEAGSADACDVLWRAAPPGSAAERFAGTCGRRTAGEVAGDCRSLVPR